MEKRKVAVLGDPNSVMIYKAIGLDVYYEEQAERIAKKIHELADQGYAIIYITEEAALQVPEVLAAYTAATYPAIIPIPGGKGSLGLGMRNVKANVEKAVGADILFKEG